VTVAASERWWHLRRRSLAAFCALLGGLLLGSPSALAAGQRGHVFSFAFGSEGAGPEQFRHPSGIAVNSSTGDVYVTDREDGRVEEFEPIAKGGELVSEKLLREFRVPYAERIAVDNCTNAGSPCSAAEDPSVGDVYVTGAESEKDAKKPGAVADVIYKLTSAGVAIGEITKFESSQKKSREKFKGKSLDGVTVDSGGALLVDPGGVIEKFNDAETNAGVSSVHAGVAGAPTPGLAVDSAGDLYVAAVASRAEAGGEEALEAVLAELEEARVPVLARLDGATGSALLHELDYEDSTAVAVNPASVPANGVHEENDVYVTNVATVAGEQVTTVAAFSPGEGSGSGADGEGQLIQRFGAPGLQAGEGLAVDSATGTVYVTDAATDRVDVFELEPRGAPTVEGLATSAENGATILHAQVNPAGAATEYEFEYGTASCASGVEACTKAPAANLAAGFGASSASTELRGLAPGIYHYRVSAENGVGPTVHSEEGTFTVLAPISGLPDGREWELVTPPNKAGAEPEAITREGGLIQAAASGDAITYVADGPIPPEGEPEGARNPEFTQVLSTRDREPGHSAWVSQDLQTPNTTGSGTTIGEAPEYEFFSRSLALALVNPIPSDNEGPFANPVLSPPLTGETEGEQENTIYLRDNAPRGLVSPEASEAENYEKAHRNGEARENPGFLALVTKFNDPCTAVLCPHPATEAEFGRRLLPEGTASNGGVRPSGATADLSHVVFRSETGRPGLFEWTGNEAEEHTIQPVSVLPGATAVMPTPQAGLGGSAGEKQATVDVRHAISEDGTLVYWTRFSEGVHLYVRDTQLKETLQLSTGESGGVVAHAVFQTASKDGSKAFFTDSQRLTPDSGAEEGKPDLYVFEPEIVGGHLAGKVTDLTPQAHEGADVLARSEFAGGVIGASEDGSYVYFVANGILASGATRGHCASEEPAPRPPETTCNLYVRHYDEATQEWEKTRFIAALSFEDAPDWGGSGARGDLGFLTSRVSPNGRYVAFMSDRSLTGYDNEDISSAGSGEKRLDEEVYLFDAEQGSLVCVSCNPTGAQPQGVLDTRAPSGEGLGLVVDRREIWSATQKESEPIDHWLAASIPGWTTEDIQRALYQSRYLSNSGRLFFDAADALVPLKQPTRTESVNGRQQEVGVENVYEYEPAGEGGCASAGGCLALITSGASEHESAFLDASEDGNDVFFLTQQRLVPADRDSAFDIYDAHVCEAAAPCPVGSTPPPPRCESEECQGSYEAVPLAPASGTAAFSGAGNPVLPKVVVLSETAKVGPRSGLTRAQQLAKALKTCRTKYKKKKAKRIVCEKQAKKKYGPQAKKTSSARSGR
jgi:DNA-binding beta-propeller fold protein YncE